MCSGVVEVAHQARHVAVIDDAGVIRIVGKRGIECGHTLLRGCGERLLLRAGQQYVIGCDAGLPGVQALSEQNLVGCLLNIAFRPNDGGRFSAEFQCHRRQVFGSRAHHVAPNSGGTGKQQVIERQRRKRLCDRGIAIDDRNVIRTEILRRQFCKQFTCARREFAHLDHHPVTR